MAQENYKTCCFTEKEAKEVLLTKNPFSSDTQKRNDLKGKSLLQCLFTDPGYMVWLIYGTYPKREYKVDFQQDIQKAIVILDQIPVAVDCFICKDEPASHYVFDRDVPFGKYVCKNCMPKYKNMHNLRGVSEPLKIQALYNRFTKSDSRLFANLLKEYMGLIKADLKRFDESKYLEFVLKKSSFVKPVESMQDLSKAQTLDSSEETEHVQLSFEF